MSSDNTAAELKASTEQLVRRARAKDSGALDELLRFCRPVLMRHALRLIGDRDAAQDVVQETLIQLHRNIGQLVEPAAFWGWAKTILRHEANDHFHKQKRYVHDSVDRSDGGVEPGDDFDLLAESEIHGEMDRHLRQLRHEDRNLLSLFYWREFGVAEIAAMHGVAVGAMKLRLFRARSRLRDLLVESDRFSTQGQVAAAKSGAAT
jgi:RNA polymerase sigma-70 factor (ECF subfamily)